MATKMKTKRTCWRHLGSTVDVTVFHDGGERHWVQARKADGALISSRWFAGRSARERAIAHAQEEIERLETCRYCGDPATPDTHGEEPACERHRGL